MASGECRRSPSQAYQLCMQSDGNLVMYGPNGPNWSTSTFIPGSRMAFQTDGHLVIYAPEGDPIWWSNRKGTRLAVQDDGNLVIYTPTGPVWASLGQFGRVETRIGNRAIPTLREGQCSSGQRAFSMVVQTDGNLVTYRTRGGVEWATYTTGQRPAVLMPQSDGNTVLYAANGPRWWTNTGGRGGARAYLRDEGLFSVATPDGQIHWSSGGIGQAGRA